VSAIARHSNTCSSCGAGILWAETERGKPIPLDVEPVVVQPIDASLFVVKDGIAITLPRSDGNLLVYQTHFATCADAGRFRR
jgi:hypothetical protein